MEQRKQPLLFFFLSIYLTCLPVLELEDNLDKYLIIFHCALDLLGSLSSSVLLYL